MITLPLSAETDDGNKKAQQRLQAAIDASDDKALMIVYGSDSPDIEQVLAVCKLQIIDTRTLVYCQDPGVLSTDQKARFFQTNMVVATVGDPKATTAAMFLNLQDAKDGDKIGAAFRAAEKQ